VEYLLHRGLVKKYRKQERNSLALKGSLLFGKHIQQNLVHQERFYVSQTVYDREHPVHSILWKTIRLLRRINSNQALQSRIAALQLNFPEMPDIKVTEATFQKMQTDRKTQHYKNALEIARMLLLNYHPDLSGGQNNVLALMFEMNYLWEAFVYRSLLNHAPSGVDVREQVYKQFWKKEGGYAVGMQADIIIKDTNSGINYVLDTKWKNIGDNNPSPEDLRQLYTYSHYYGAEKAALVYPGKTLIRKGHYYDVKGKELSDRSCALISLDVNNDVLKWQKEIACEIFGKWMNLPDFNECNA
jgi:5-methylcytosine-specific restriction enzyme subunit McrC